MAEQEKTEGLNSGNGCVMLFALIISLLVVICESGYKTLDKIINKNNDYSIETSINDTLFIDQASKLTWQLSGSDQLLNIEEAIQYIDNLNKNMFGGVDNWRLPTVDEALSIMEKKNNGFLYIDSKFDTKQYSIWVVKSIWVIKLKRLDKIYSYITVDFRQNTKDNPITAEQAFVRAIHDMNYDKLNH